MVVCSFVFLVITLAITLYYFITDYIVEKILKLDSYEMRNKKKNIMNTISRYQVHPMSIEEIAE